MILLAAVFTILYSITLTLSPAALFRSWAVDLRWSHWIGAAVWLLLFIPAHYITTRRLPHSDPYLLPVTLLLSAWGTLTIWRVLPFYGGRQAVWAAFSLAVYLVGLYLPSILPLLRRYKYVWLSGGLLLIGLTFFFGTNPSGSGPPLWLGCCGVYVQPSEPLKILLLVYLAAYLASLSLPERRRSEEGGSTPKAQSPLLPLIAPTLLMTGIALLLLLVQRDLGTASIFVFLYTTMLYLATSEKRVVLIGALVLAAAAVTGYLLFDVVRLRIEAWANPWLDPAGRSYQIVQSLIAIANGGMVGRGPGLGSPSLVPIAHSDFVFTAIIEENGLLGAVGLLTLLGLFAQRGLTIAMRASDAFQRYLAAGLTLYLVGQSLLIISGNIRLLPLTGVTLPFVSYGGSSLVTAFVSLLILMHISNQPRESQRPHGDSRPYLVLGGLLFAGLGAAALVTGWWAYQRSPALLARTDNPRRSIADRFVQRGSILDRNNQVISSSSGSAGSYTRRIDYPALSAVLGYTHPVYGQAGLEADMDAYLRGLRGNPGVDIWWNHVLYGQPPPGVDLRTSLDLELQAAVDEALGSRAGAAVLLNADTGEILAMATQPGFDANRLDEQWQSLIQDERSPLLNRAVQGRYPAEPLFSRLFPEGSEAFGFQQSSLPGLQGEETASGEQSNTLSPLQAALGAATLSAAGIQPAPVLVNAVNTPAAGWVLLPAAGEEKQILLPNVAEDRLRPFTSPDTNLWETVVSTQQEGGGGITWYLGGSQPGGSGLHLALALVLEEDNPELAGSIGRQVLSAATP